jgi:transcriptional regulator with PAS, ATPase and Fis domain
VPELHLMVETLRDYAGFLSELLRADVEIIDRTLARIVGTGYYECADNLISGGSIYHEVFRTERYVLIQDPKKHEVCLLCKFRARCLEKMEIACPIISGGVLAGAIGVGCKNNLEKDHIMANLKLYMFILNKIAMFIGKNIAVNNTLSNSIRQINELKDEVAYVSDKASLGSIRRLADIERDEIDKALDYYGRDTAGKQKAAKALGIGIATLYRKINEEK